MEYKAYLFPRSQQNIVTIYVKRIMGPNAQKRNMWAFTSDSEP